MEPIIFTFEEACSAVADLFEAVPESYGVGDFARNEFGNVVPLFSGEACRFCSVGGVRAAMNNYSFLNTNDRLHVVAKALGYEDVYQASDSSREVAIRMLRIAAGELPMPKRGQA